MSWTPVANELARATGKTSRNDVSLWKHAETETKASCLRFVTGAIRGGEDAPSSGGVRLFGAHEALLSKELSDLFPVRGRYPGAELPEGHAEVNKERP